MGTAQEWFRVFVAGSLFGGFLGFLGLAHSRPKFVQRPRIYLKLNILFYVLSGLGYGIFDAFIWRAFRSPLVYLTVGIIACALPVAFILRRYDRTLPRLPKTPALFPVPDFSRAGKKPDASDAT